MMSRTMPVVTVSIIPWSSSWCVGREHDVFLDHHVEAVARPHLDGGLDVEVLLERLTHHVAEGRGHVVHAGLAEGERDVANAGVARCRTPARARRPYGEQEESAYNGHFGCTCYHPLFVFNQFGDLERCALRPGNVHSAEGWREVLEPVIARYRMTMKRRYFRADAGFAAPEVYELLEAEGYGYVIRLPANAVLQRRIAHLLKRPVGRPPHEVRRFYASFRYQAQTWSHSRRVVAKVEWHPGELYPRVGFLVTNLCRPP